MTFSDYKSNIASALTAFKHISKQNKLPVFAF